MCGHVVNEDVKNIKGHTLCVKTQHGPRTVSKAMDMTHPYHVSAQSQKFVGEIYMAEYFIWIEQKILQLEYLRSG